MPTIDTFFSGNNGARVLLRGSNDLSHQAESNDTHNDHDFKIFRRYLGPFCCMVWLSVKLPKCAINTG